jgi:hypothetical protein
VHPLSAVDLKHEIRSFFFTLGTTPGVGQMLLQASSRVLPAAEITFLQEQMKLVHSGPQT